jgi:hypothetical protein
MSPRATSRLETLGFEHIYDDAGGKADWLAHNLPRECDLAGAPRAGDLLDDKRLTCQLDADHATIAATLEHGRHGFCLVVTDHDVVLGRVRRSVVEHAAAGATAEQLMEPGPRTRRHPRPRTLLDRLASRELTTALVTTPEGRLLGVFSRASAARRLQE